ncbi:MAG: hypothetical protein NXI09_09825 [Bacteroidetes bacterium]|nr:hypothetical protein [Bacteroidota bacterium]
MENIKAPPLLDPSYRRKKLIAYLVRSLIAIALYWYFWSVSWVPYTLWIYIPINLIGLIMLTILPKFLEKKMQKAQAAMEDAQAVDIEAEEVNSEEIIQIEDTNNQQERN